MVHKFISRLSNKLSIYKCKKNKVIQDIRKKNKNSRKNIYKQIYKTRSNVKNSNNYRRFRRKRIYNNVISHDDIINNNSDEKIEEQLNNQLYESLNKNNKKQNYKRRRLPHGIREKVWTHYNGYKFNAKCNVSFCDKILTPFDFDVGHNVPVSKGGSDSIDNLRPICRVCNVSMSNKYTIDEYDNIFKINKNNKGSKKTKAR